MTVLPESEPELGCPVFALPAEEQAATRSVSATVAGYPESEAEVAPIAMRATARLYSPGRPCARALVRGGYARSLAGSDAVDLLYFVLLVSSLIFIHESGHFAFAKIFGVKVLTFSIGFGPKVVRIRGKETEYCVGLLPFGGFVKMLEESKTSEPILPEERGRTFEAQALWKRIMIVLAGPAMNVLFPIALYTSVFLEEKQFLPPMVGVVEPGGPAGGELEPGDRIVSVDGDPVTSYPEVRRGIAQRASK